MTLQDIITRHRTRFLAEFGDKLTPEQWSALNAIEGCRSGQYGQIEWACSDCRHTQLSMNSCGHRSCNQCQNGSTQTWLDRQMTKLLPVTYFMVTFTLPRELRALAKAQPEQVYRLLMAAAADTLKTFAQNDAVLNGDIGFCAVLHTHTRRLDFHPHVHIVVPGGAINQRRRQWRKAKGDYLFNGKALARVFRGKLLCALSEAGLTAPKTPRKWVVQCQKVGRGKEALRYLARYLYRGVISNDNIIDDDGQNITFRYRESKTNIIKTRTVAATEFIRLILQHSLPKGFRRARDYGFLHGNARRTLSVVQWVFKVAIARPDAQKRKATIACPKCKSGMRFVQHHRISQAPEPTG